MELISLTKYYLAATLPDLNITRTTTITTTIMEVIKSQKGRLKKTAVIWECSNCVAFSCKAAITTDLEMKTVTSSTPHTHDPHDNAVSATKLRTTMRERVGSSRGTLTQLLTDITSDAPIEVRAELGNPETIKQSLRRERAKNLPKNPNSVGDLVLEDEWTKTSDGDQFMIYNNGVDSSNRMLVFGTDEGLHHLASSTTWFLDGTFNVMSEGLMSVYWILFTSTFVWLIGPTSRTDVLVVIDWLMSRSVTPLYIVCCVTIIFIMNCSRMLGG